MGLSIYQISKLALARTGITPPASLVRATDDTSDQLLAIIYETADDVMSRLTNWQALQTEAQITTTDNDDQGDMTVMFPDFHRFVDDTMFNRTKRQKLVGPIRAEDWQNAKSGFVSMPVYQWWRMRDNHLLLYGQTLAGQTITFEYVRNTWLRSSDRQNRRYEVKADTDEPLLPQSVLIPGIRWRMQDARGLDYSEAFRAYEKHLSERSGADGGRMKMNLTPGSQYRGSDFSYPFDTIVKTS